MKLPCYEIILETPTYILIRDIGPWDRHPTVTNAAEAVVAELAPLLHGRRLEYCDSEGNRDEIVVRDGRFAGFRAGNVTMNAHLTRPHR